MDIGVISVRYARALLKCSMEEGLEDKVYRDMQTLAKSYVEVPKLRVTIDNPMIAKESKKALLLAAAGKEPAALTGNFIGLVLKEERESVMQFIANSYVTLYRKQKNIIRGKLTPATAVT